MSLFKKPNLFISRFCLRRRLFPFVLSTNVI